MIIFMFFVVGCDNPNTESTRKLNINSDEICTHKAARENKEVEEVSEVQSLESNQDENILEVERILKDSVKGIKNVRMTRNFELTVKPNLSNETRNTFKKLGYTDNQLNSNTEIILTSEILHSIDVTEIRTNTHASIFGTLFDSTFIQYEDKVNNIKYSSGETLGFNGKNGYKEELKEKTDFLYFYPLKGYESCKLTEDENNYYIVGAFNLDDLFGISEKYYDLNLDGLYDVQFIIDKNSGFLYRVNVIFKDTVNLKEKGISKFDLSMRLNEHNNIEVKIPSSCLNYDFKKEK